MWTLGAPCPPPVWGLVEVVVVGSDGEGGTSGAQARWQQPRLHQIGELRALSLTWCRLLKLGCFTILSVSHTSAR